MDRDIYCTIERVKAIESVLNIDTLLPHQAELLNKHLNKDSMETEEEFVVGPNIKDNIVKKQVAEITHLKEENALLKTSLEDNFSKLNNASLAIASSPNSTQIDPNAFIDIAEVTPPSSYTKDVNGVFAPHHLNTFND